MISSRSFCNAQLMSQPVCKVPGFTVRKHVTDLFPFSEYHEFDTVAEPVPWRHWADAVMSFTGISRFHLQNSAVRVQRSKPFSRTICSTPNARQTPTRSAIEHHNTRNAIKGKRESALAWIGRRNSGETKIYDINKNAAVNATNIARYISQSLCRAISTTNSPRRSCNT